MLSKPSHNSGDVTILKKLQDIRSGIIFLLIEVWLTPEKSTQQLIPRSDVYKNNQALVSYGANATNYNALLEAIQYQEQKLPLDYLHFGLGWTELENKLVFQHFNAFPVDSYYAGNLSIEPKGSYNGWRDTIIKYAMSKTALQLGIIIGLSAVTAGFLKDVLDGSVFIHIFGDSSKGKTTLAMLAESTAGNPNNISPNTLMCDWSDTANYKISVLKQNFGFPVVFDELSKSTESNLSEFCYNIANGREKGRLSSNSVRTDTNNWCTTILSTGEASLLARCNRNNGLLVRVIELQLDDITESANYAENLKNGILGNYGFANLILAEYILKNTESVLEFYRIWRDRLTSNLGISNPIVARLSKKIAVIMLTAEISSHVLELDFDIDGIEQIFIEAVKSQCIDNAFDSSEKLIQFILEDLAANPEHYQEIKTNSPFSEISRNRIAVIKSIKPIAINEDEECEKEINFFPNGFERLIKSGGFTDVNMCLNDLKKRHYLYTEKGHNSVKRKIDGKQLRVYCVRFPNRLFN